MKKGLFLLFLLLILAGCYNNYNSIIISYNTYGGSFVELEKIQTGENIKTNKITSKEGYDFGGWYYDDSFLLKAESTDLIVNNVVLHAKWIPKEYEIVFMDSDTPSIKAPYLSEISLPVLETIEERYFIGWYLDEALTIPFYLEYMPLDGARLYPRFETEQIVVRFFNGEDLVKIELCEYDSFILPPEGPQKYGYEFTNWDRDLNNITESIDVFAEFTLKEYKINFHLDNNQDIITKTYSYLNPVTRPKTPEKAGFVFAGWFLDPEFKDEYFFDFFKDENLNLYAKWENPFIYTLKDNDTYKITNYNGDLKSLVIPNEYNGKIISEIDVYAFSNNYQLENLEIGENIKEIGEYAFKNCPNLKTVSMMESINMLGKGVFSECERIEEITIPFIGKSRNENEGLDYLFARKDALPKKVAILDIKEVKEKAFEDCKGIKEIVLPEEIIKIGKNAFANCYDLEKINFPINLEIISEASFLNCIELKQIVFNEKIKVIDDYAFFGCTKLEEIYDIEKTELESLGKGAFFGCDSIKMFHMPNSVMTIGEGAFAFCKNLRLIILPKEIITIEDYLFFNCEGLEYIYLPYKVKSIGLKAFGKCATISEVFLPRSLEHINEEAFAGGKEGINVSFQGSAEEWIFNIPIFQDFKYDVNYAYYLG